VLWVGIFLAIALAGVAMLVCYGVWLAHKTSDVLAEVAVLGERGAALADLVATVSFPETTDVESDGRNAPQAPFHSA
jgi:hypothetical protein